MLFRSSLRDNRVYEPDPRLARARRGLKQSAAHYATAHADAPETPLLQRLSGNLQNINHRLSTLDSGLDENPSADQRIAHHDSAKLRDALKSIAAQLNP